MIKAEAKSLGFFAVGIAKSRVVDDIQMSKFNNWIDKGYHGTMSYMKNNVELRRDPSLLLENCKSIIVFAINYYPKEKQNENLPQISYYAYGRDYHKVIKSKLKSLQKKIEESYLDNINIRFFTDSAPIMERYWAVKAGLGFIGKNSLLIIPKAGSFYFLATMLLDIELDYDEEYKGFGCGNCSRCINACPAQAICDNKTIDARACLSYLTIEHKGDIDNKYAKNISNQLYGCDICQKVCPYNRNAKSTEINDFDARKDLLNLDIDLIMNMTEAEFDKLSQGSPIRRAGLEKLKSTIRQIKLNNK